MNLKLLLLFTSLAGGTLAADDLVTRDGTTYSDYTVTGHDAGYLTIVYADGDGKVRLSDLPDALQKQYGYDPAKAKAAVAAEETKWNLATGALIGLAVTVSFWASRSLFARFSIPAYESHSAPEDDLSIRGNEMADRPKELTPPRSGAGGFRNLRSRRRDPSRENRAKESA